MSMEVFIRGLFSGFIALIFAWMVFSRNDEEIGTEDIDDKHQKYLPFIHGAVLPAIILALSLFAYHEYGIKGAMEMTMSMCFAIFLHICIYYLILLMVLPYLRRWISARTCAMLWLMPNYLYMIHYSHMELPSPLLVITAPGKSAYVLSGIWFIGFATVMLWKMIEHLMSCCVSRTNVMVWTFLTGFLP